MRRFATFWASLTSLLLVGVLTGLYDLAGPTERSIRGQRCRLSHSAGHAVGTSHIRPSTTTSVTFGLTNASAAVAVPLDGTWITKFHPAAHTLTARLRLSPARAPPVLS